MLKKGIIPVILWLGLALAGAGGAYFLIPTAEETKVDKNAVVFRIGHAVEDMDYDLAAALDFFEYKLKSYGYDVKGRTYGGNLYPKEFDNAGINIFVRGFPIFFDSRMNKNAVDVFYVHRFVRFYLEELNNYDFYITSQKAIKDAAGTAKNMQILPVGAIPREKLVPQYEYDILYIYEYYNSAYDAFIQRFYNPKSYSGMKFAALSNEEKTAELKKARLVIYDMGVSEQDDKDYVPYAVYDIISYGRPVLTNKIAPLTEHFGETVATFDNAEEMAVQTVKLLKEEDSVRESYADAARGNLKRFIDVEIPMLKTLKAQKTDVMGEKR